MSTLPPPGTGYFVAPARRPGEAASAAVLLVPSPWGLTPSFKQRADELADAGYTVLAPDLNDAVVAVSDAEADDALAAMDMNVTASLVQSSLRLLQAATERPDRPVGVIGFAAGASWALWLSERFAASCAAVVAYYGTQSIEFRDTTSSYLVHVGDADRVVTDDELALMGLHLQLARRPLRLERHAGAGHGFAERERPSFDAASDAVAWRQTLEFLAEHVPAS